MASKLNITNVNVYPVTSPNAPSSLKANVTFCVNDALVVKGRIVEGKNGLFVSLPSTKGTDKETGEDRYYDEVYTTAKEVTQELNEVVLAAWQEKAGSETPATATSGSEDTIPF